MELIGKILDIARHVLSYHGVRSGESTDQVTHVISIARRRPLQRAFPRINFHLNVRLPVLIHLFHLGRVGSSSQRPHGIVFVDVPLARRCA